MTDNSNSRQFFAPSALLPTGWKNNVLITVDENGWITDVKPGQNRGTVVDLGGSVLPGMPNVHSHAFQRAMAGLAEHGTGTKDNFWTWRETMYQFLMQVKPEDQQAIAAQVYMEMLKAGFTSVGEFHYLHHDINGKPYDDAALASQHILKAAHETGIAITHIPVLYAHGGFGGQKMSHAQKRFYNTEEQIIALIQSLHKQYKNHPQVRIGLGFHSLRAVTPSMLKTVMDALGKLAADLPVHIHISEQMDEVSECIAWSNQRPVEWLLNNVDINQQWCLVHATHMNEMEMKNLGKTGAVVGLCPTTEANLGDGIFNLPDFLEQHQEFGIGSDSNISVNMIEELRWLEYGQRLFHQQRLIAKSDKQPSVGAYLFGKAVAGGNKALARKAGSIAPGMRADFIALDNMQASLFNKSDNQILDAMIFASNSNPIRHVIVGGQHLVKDFHHIAEEKIAADYRKTIASLYDGRKKHEHI